MTALRSAIRRDAAKILARELAPTSGYTADPVIRLDERAEEEERRHTRMAIAAMYAAARRALRLARTYREESEVCGHGRREFDEVMGSVATYRLAIKRLRKEGV